MAIGRTAASIFSLSTLGIVPASAFRGRGAGQQDSSPTPLPQAPSADAAQDKAGEIIKRRRASATQSVYTSPLGVGGQANVARKTLLGQ